MSTYYRVHSDRLEEELKNTTEEEAGKNYYIFYIYIGLYYFY